MDLINLLDYNKEKIKEHNPVNNLQDFRNIKVFVHTYSKTGTTSLARSFQYCIDKTTNYKNVSHSHTMGSCWYKYLPFLQNKNIFLKDILNIQSSIPILIQSYRNPIDRLISQYYDIFKKNDNNLLINFCLKYIYDNYCFLSYTDELNINYDNKIFNYEKGYGFENKEDFYILHTRLDKINNLPDNIKSIPELKEFHNLSIIKDNVNKSNEYIKFKKNIKIPKELIDLILFKEKSVIEFYFSNNEINNIKLKVEDISITDYDWSNTFPTLPNDFNYTSYLKDNNIIIQNTSLYNKLLLLNNNNNGINSNSNSNNDINNLLNNYLKLYAIYSYSKSFK
jgi:hypothetical protein